MIEKFENVSAITKANVYFDGKVISHTIYLPGGERKTLGILLPGDYEFGTGDAEIMDMIDGAVEVRMPGATEFKPFKAGEKFQVPPDSKFGLRCAVISQYICSYIPKK